MQDGEKEIEKGSGVSDAGENGHAYDLSDERNEMF